MPARFLTRFKALVFRRAADADLDEELRYHLDREIERNVASGMSRRSATDAARRAFGNATIATEDAREELRWRFVEELRQDVAFSARTFRRAPAFVFTVIATIGLGLGLLASAFTFLDAYVLRALPVRDPHALYDLGWTSADGRKHRFTPHQYQELAANRAIFSESFAYTNVQSRLRGAPAAGQFVSGNYFQMLGVPPAIGRTILPSDAESGESNAVVVLSHRTWRNTFGGDSAILGKRVTLNGAPFEIIGVAREGFGGLTSAPFDFWAPITIAATAAPARGASAKSASEGLFVVGRLAPHVSESRAHAMLLTWMRAQTAGEPILARAADVSLLSRGTSMPRNADTVALFAPVVLAFALVLLIACANVANIMLARGMARQREIGIRLALGAGRHRLIRQLLTEAALLALPAAAFGFLVSRGVIRASLEVMYRTVPAAYAGYLRVIPLDASGNVMAFMLAAAVGAAFVFGLVPALQATRPNIVQASRGDFDTQHRPSRLRNGLIVAQITFSVLLLVSAGVLLRGARNTRRLDPGVRTADVVQIELLDRTFERGVSALRDDPLVRAVATASSPALDGAFSEVPILTGGRPAEAANYNIVSPGYFTVLDLPIIAGRAFTDDEARGRASVAIVSRSTAEHLWPGRDPLGQVMIIPPTARDYKRLTPYHSVRVIGVTNDAAPGFIGKNPRAPTVYFPQPLDGGVTHLMVRVNGPGELALPKLEHLLAGVDSAAVVEMHTLASSLALQVYPFRAVYWVACALAAIALLLTLIGVYGVMSYLVTQRRKEFGIRLALGAAGVTLVSLVVRQSMRLAFIGAGLGLILALGVSRVFASLLFNLDTFDAAGYAGGVGVVLAACAAAAYAPSRRAAAVNPTEVLRLDS